MVRFPNRTPDRPWPTSPSKSASWDKSFRSAVVAVGSSAVRRESNKAADARQIAIVLIDF